MISSVVLAGALLLGQVDADRGSVATNRSPLAGDKSAAAGPRRDPQSNVFVSALPDRRETRFERSPSTRPFLFPEMIEPEARINDVFSDLPDIGVGGCG
jgi:hypothetical protein